MHLDLFGDLLEHAKTRLRALGYDAADMKTGDDLFLQWRHAEERVPPSIPWKMLESREVRQKRSSLPPHLLTGLDELVRKAQAGEPLRPHLSRKILDAESTDPMLMEWGITHFHLRRTTQANGLVEGTKEIVAAIADAANGTLYLIDVQPHAGFWTRQDFIDIVDKNWPPLTQARELKGVTATGNYSDVEREASLLAGRRDHDRPDEREGPARASQRAPAPRARRAADSRAALRD